MNDYIIAALFMLSALLIGMVIAMLYVKNRKPTDSNGQPVDDKPTVVIIFMSSIIAHFILFVVYVGLKDEKRETDIYISNKEINKVADMKCKIKEFGDKVDRLSKITCGSKAGTDGADCIAGVCIPPAAKLAPAAPAVPVAAAAKAASPKVAPKSIELAAAAKNATDALQRLANIVSPQKAPTTNNVVAAA